MRGHGNHIAPWVTQRPPLDNTSVFVNGQIQTWRESGTLPHEESAREIAAWYPDAYGSDYAPFASTGTITQELINDLTQVPDTSDDKSALRAYVLACLLPAGCVWTVGHNLPGYSPESDVATFTDRSEALDALESDAEFGSEAIKHEEEKCVRAGDCDACGNESLIASVLAEAKSEAGKGKDVHITLDDGAKQIVYWATANTAPVPVKDLIDHSRV